MYRVQIGDIWCVGSTNSLDNFQCIISLLFSKWNNFIMALDFIVTILQSRVNLFFIPLQNKKSNKIRAFFTLKQKMKIELENKTQNVCKCGLGFTLFAFSLFKTVQYL